MRCWVIAVVMVAGCASAPRTLVASLQRGACFGRCPIYKVSLYSDGVVEWEGRRFVRVVGYDRGRVSPADIARLRELFERVHFFELHDQYEDEDITDMPSAVTTYVDGGRAKTVEHDHGDPSAPRDLGRLERAIDLVLRTPRWIGDE